jgi:polyhydroxybutyrate depolymerase
LRILRLALAALVVAGLMAGTAALALSRPTHHHRATARAACAPLAAGTRRVPVQPGRIPVVLHVPTGLRNGAPLVLALPGAGQTARDFASYTGYSTLADRLGFAVAYPTAVGARPFWNITDAPGQPDDVAYLRKVIAAAVQATCADPARVGVTGVSNGGGMAARMACDAPDLVAAAAPVAGGYGALPACRPSRPVPILEVHGTSDQVVPYAGKGPTASGAVSTFLAQWRRLDGCPAKGTTSSPSPKVTELRWSACGGGTVVLHDRIADQDHGWPGEDDLSGVGEFSSTRATYRFLSSFRRPG